jgi:hypothetical protein
MNKTDRSFTVSKATTLQNTLVTPANEDTGRYISKTPSSAAKKAFTQLVSGTQKKALYITVRETTTGSLHKEYSYLVKREPVTTVADWTPDAFTFKWTVSTKSRKL